MGRRGQIVNRVGQEHRQELAKLIKQASYSHATWQIWDDLMYMSAAALSQPVSWVQAREDEYLRRIGRYDKKTQALFPQMFGEIILAFEQEGLVDVLGDMYMQLELHNKWKGQFFTPSHICELMAKMVDTDITAEIENRGYASIVDPCCGGGAMLLAYAKVAHEAGVNYQTDVLFVGQDIDPVVARMCYISMSLLGMPGYVIIGNSLLMDKENWDYWFTPMYFIHGFQWRQQQRETVEAVVSLTTSQENTESSDTEIPETEKSTLQAAKETQVVEYNENKVGQLTLFSA